MKSIVFSDQCTIFKGSGEIRDLPVLLTYYYGLGRAIISCWRPSFREWLDLLLGRPIYVCVLGTKHPPILVTTDGADLRIAETEKAHGAKSAAES